MILVSIGRIIALGLVQCTVFPEVAIITQSHAKLRVHRVKDGTDVTVIVRKTVIVVIAHLDIHLVAHRLGI